MADCQEINERLRKISVLKSSLNVIDEKLRNLVRDLNWDYDKLIEEKPCTMVTCSINNQHRVPSNKIKIHEEKCQWHKEGYQDDDKPFSEHSGVGSFITIPAEMLHTITSQVSSSVGEGNIRPVPQTSTNLDQNFNREEKLAVYDYVIANTQKQRSFSDLCLQPLEEKKEKKEMTAWEIAAAERDAKRRRASYRNKVHTNRKTHTEILREVIEGQMEIFKEENDTRVTHNTSKSGWDKDGHRKHREQKNFQDTKYSYHETSTKRNRVESGRFNECRKYSYHDTADKRDRNEKHKYEDHNRHSKSRDHRHRRSPSIDEIGSKSRSRSHDKHRKWKSNERRSFSHKSSKY